MKINQFMYKLLVIVLLFVLCSCTDTPNNLKITKYPHIIVKKSYNTGRNGLFEYTIKVFDGYTVKWYKVDSVDYNSVEEGDTLKNFTTF